MSKYPFFNLLDSYDADALCVSCTVEGRSNLPGEEYVLEDLTEDYAGLSKPTIRWIFQMMLDEEHLLCLPLPLPERHPHSPVLYLVFS